MLSLLATVATIILTLGISWLLYPAWVVRIADRLEWTVEDLSDSNGKSQSKQKQQPTLSLVVPAYNEQDRIATMIQEAHDFLVSTDGAKVLQKLQALVTPTGNKKQPLSVEWIFVNDGSKDDTCQVVREAYKKSTTNHAWKIVSLKQNSGKGAAVKTGMLLAQGDFHLMVDADGATDFGKGLENLTKAMTEQATLRDTQQSLLSAAAFGSRAHLQNEASAQRSFVRTLHMKAFHFFVSLFVSSKIQDTQCGFKLFPIKASRAIFGALHLRRWAFDTEIVLLCEQLNIPILEVGVPWHEVDGSKLSTSKLALAIVSITMLRDMICVRACYTFGIWKVNKTSSSTDRIIQK